MKEVLPPPAGFERSQPSSSTGPRINLDHPLYRRSRWNPNDPKVKAQEEKRRNELEKYLDDLKAVWGDRWTDP